MGTDTFTGVNAIRATQFADTLLGGNPLLNGFESFEGRAGDDYIEGGQGFDLAVYAFDGAITTGITVDLAAGTVSGDPLLTGTDTLRGIEGIRGSHLNDGYDATGFSSSSVNAGSLGPSGTYNEFEGMAGNDTITGNGNTRIIYTAAREGVSVDLAAGTAVGGASVGTDTIVGGVFAVRGSNFNDVLIGSAASEYFEGRAGNDAIDGGDGFDTAAYDVGASSGGTFLANAAGDLSASAAGPWRRRAVQHRVGHRHELRRPVRRLRRIARLFRRRAQRKRHADRLAGGRLPERRYRRRHFEWRRRQ